MRKVKLRLTLARLVPSFLLPLGPTPGPVPGACCWGIDLEALAERGATGRLVPTPTAGEMERGGTLGGGPGSPAPGERRWDVRIEFISGISAGGAGDARGSRGGFSRGRWRGCARPPSCAAVHSCPRLSLLSFPPLVQGCYYCVAVCRCAAACVCRRAACLSFVSLFPCPSVCLPLWSLCRSLSRLASPIKAPTGARNLWCRRDEIIGGWLGAKSRLEQPEHTPTHRVQNAECGADAESSPSCRPGLFVHRSSAGSRGTRGRRDARGAAATADDDAESRRVGLGMQRPVSGCFQVVGVWAVSPVGDTAWARVVEWIDRWAMVARGSLRGARFPLLPGLASPHPRLQLGSNRAPATAEARTALVPNRQPAPTKSTLRCSVCGGAPGPE